jgi:hypothetical protein
MCFATGGHQINGMNAFWHSPETRPYNQDGILGHVLVGWVEPQVKPNISSL